MSNVPRMTQQGDKRKLLHARKHSIAFRERVARDWFCPTLLLFSDKANSQCTVAYDVTEGLEQVSERGNADDAGLIYLAMAFLDDAFGRARWEPSVVHSRAPCCRSSRENRTPGG